MDVTTLASAMGNRAGVDYGSHLAGINAALVEASCTTVNRVAMFCAQVGEESGGLQFMTELANGSEYEGRVDLGNTQLGDGPRFKGRGPIQVTGRNNYYLLSQWAFSRGHVPTGTYFIDNPEQLALEQYVWLGPVWYWTVARPQLNALADAGDVQGATRAVNGGLNGLADREARWAHCLSLGGALLPQSISEDDGMAEITPARFEALLYTALSSKRVQDRIVQANNRQGTTPTDAIELKQLAALQAAVAKLVG